MPGTGDPLPPRGTLLGFDFGLARIGVAMGELETGRASALTVIAEESNDGRFRAIAALIEEWRPIALVVGIPRQSENESHPLAARCERFANQLHGRFALPVERVDERFSSVEADARLRDAGQHDWRQRKASVDAMAAQIILQSFLDTYCHARA